MHEKLVAKVPCTPVLSPSTAADQPPTWPQLRCLGAGFWLRDFGLLATLAERLAKQQFAARRNADDCALLYCALGKRSVLQVSCPCWHAILNGAPIELAILVQTDLACWVTP